MSMRSSASRLGLTTRRLGLMRWTAPQPALTTPRRAVTGLPQAVSTPHVSITATLLQNGMVLVAGGLDTTNFPFASAELYDPASASSTAACSMHTGRAVAT